MNKVDINELAVVRAVTDAPYNMCKLALQLTDDPVKSIKVVYVGLWAGVPPICNEEYVRRRAKFDYHPRQAFELIWDYLQNNKGSNNEHVLAVYFRAYNSMSDTAELVDEGK